MKNFICVFCFGSNGYFCWVCDNWWGAGGSAGESKSKLTEADLQRMGITHGGYGNSN